MAVRDDEHTEVGPGRWREAVLVAVCAAGVAAGIWWLATGAASVDLRVGSGSDAREIGLGSVVLTALVVTLAAAGLLRVLERRTRHGVAIWTWASVVVLALSLAGPLGATTGAAGSCLAAMHLAVGAVVVVGLRARFARRVAWTS
ncbi:hypothetical protein GON03_02330 [Nocardioides sp. MAH-18]|uniref:Uncharacterized protein n=1 Tax=Nocardioides agri TaxID=2682843 RepID=A0A6L6XLN8_9ACTN|nr:MULTISPECIES: DUF6069 family protein [unclassified Nocardioides]MBA2953131.1 hypothetical protein [Nocardioides sp. CGMCC 1.13656]MVQ48000.1 hypothetical protein [Nocardioides sp. MAH-18]